MAFIVPAARTSCPATATRPGEASRSAVGARVAPAVAPRGWPSTSAPSAIATSARVGIVGSGSAPIRSTNAWEEPGAREHAERQSDDEGDHREQRRLRVHHPRDPLPVRAEAFHDRDIDATAPDRHVERVQHRHQREHAEEDSERSRDASDALHVGDRRREVLARALLDLSANPAGQAPHPGGCGRAGAHPDRGGIGVGRAVDTGRNRPG